MADNDWTQADATSLRTFLSQPTGAKLLRILRASLPRVTAKSMEKATLEAVEKQGAENIIDVIFQKAGELDLVTGNPFAAVDLTQEGD